MAILTSRLGLIGIAIALVLAVIGIQTFRLHLADNKIAAMQAAEKLAAAQEAAREAKGAAISQAASTAIAAAQEHTRTITRTLVEKVKVYVPAASDAQCVVSSGVVQFLDAAAQVPTAARGPVEAPSGLSISAIAATVAGNYGIAYDWKAEALGWRSWYSDQAKVWNGKP